MRRALGGEVGAGDPAPRPSALRWLMVWLLLAAVYFLGRLGVRWLLSDEETAGAGPFVVESLKGLGGHELAIVPAVQTLALALLAELRRAVKT